MSKFSVKKPLTVFVAVIAILVLGVVAYMKMTPDLLPNMDFPYVVVVTTAPGASPEKVESEITKPLEESAATLEHIQEITSSSAENVSMVILEFEEGVDLDTVGVDLQQMITSLSASWDDTVGSPYVLKINPSMIPVEIAAVSMEGMDTVELTDFLDDTLMNKLEGISGVARISEAGTIKQQIHVVLDQKKIDATNKRLRDAIEGKLDDAKSELDEKKDELIRAQEELQNAQQQVADGEKLLNSKIAEGQSQLNGKKSELLQAREQMVEQLEQLKSAKAQLDQLSSLQSSLPGMESQASTLRNTLGRLTGLQQTSEELSKLRSDYNKRVEALGASAEKSWNKLDDALYTVLSGKALKQLQTREADFEKQLADAGILPQNLYKTITNTRTELQNLESRISSARGMLSGGSLTELLAKKDEIDQGIVMLEDGIKQIDNGMLQFGDAQRMLNDQKAKGLTELADASKEIEENSAAVAEGLEQIESGYDAIEQSRDTALSQADLENTLSIPMITQILTAQNFSMPAGYVKQDGVSYMVSVGDEMKELESVSGLLIFDPGIEGMDPIRLSDVAEVMLTDNSGETYAKLNGLDGIVLSFEKQSTYATAEVSENIAKRFGELETAYPGLSFVALMDQGDYIRLIISTILDSLLTGAVLAVLILLLFLRDWRPTLITLLSIPVSVIFAIVLMYFSGVTINMISLSGLAVAVGMLVDNSVVVIENIYRLRAKGANVIQAAVSGAKQVAGAVTASTLTTVCVFLPIVFIDGITRQLFTDLALTMTFSLLASLIISLTLVPAMASGMLKKEKKHKEGLRDRLLNFYRASVSWSLRHKAIVLILALALLIASGSMINQRGLSFMPTLDMPNIAASITMPEGVTMEEAADLADEVLARIATLDGIETTGAMMSGGGGLLGGLSGGLSGGSTGERSYDVTVYITLSDQTASGMEMGKRIEELCADLDCTVDATSAMMDMSILTGSGISVRIYANTISELQEAAKQTAGVLRGIEGTEQVSDGLERSSPALQVHIDRDKAMEKGLTVAQVYMAIAAGMQNSAVSMDIDLEGVSTDVVVEIAEEDQMSRSDLRGFTVRTNGMDGSKIEVALSDIATIEETTTLSTVSRFNQRRYLTVGASIADGYNVTKVTEAAQEAMKAETFANGVSYEFSGENEAILDAVGQLLLMILLGILLVYLVMVAQFQSLLSPFIVMFTIPLAFTGGFLALLICGMEISVISLIGFVLLTGIIVNNGIVLVDYINQLRREGTERREAIAEAGATRIRPILMTSVTTILGLADMAFGRNVGTALMQPVAVVCIGGLLYATLMTLYVVPCMYDILNRRELRKVQESDLKTLDI